MKITAVLLIAALGPGAALADQYVGGYMRSDGTYVAPHHQTSPNQYRYDNYSSSGNSNPYTGQQGHQRNEYTTPPAYNQNYSNNPYYGRPNQGQSYYSR